MKIHEKYMMRCIQLAKNGLGTTYPNPLVGCVIVYKDHIIGEGWHERAGQPHAEVNAINHVKKSSLLKEATLYVNLEPCSHFGKTPPCSHLIIEKGIKKVVIGCTDPNPKVAGRGIEKLKNAGCEVIVHVLRKECEALNKRFFTFQLKKRPYIFLKWAQSQDGFIAPKSKDTQQPFWITNEFSRQLVHKMRAEEEAILVGTQTVLDDNPSLTTRDWEGSNAVRVVLDRKLRTPKHFHVFNSMATTIVITEKHMESNDLLIFETIDFSQNLPQQICEVLYAHSLQSVIVEGGAKTLQTFIDVGLWDEAFVFKGPSFLNEGIKAPLLNGELLSESKLWDDTLFHFKNNAH
ncbi:MAG: bifunctional diaminohydroxyphosphoribosylaminopyrimidine deaminase/5-amino-6-(5-phosphoribosylamino)uracil reductase RibD [Flavobacteriaceae bacterium]